MTKEIIFYLEIIEETFAHATVEGWKRAVWLKEILPSNLGLGGTLTEERLFRKLRK